MRWDEKICVITGASSGFGRDLAIELAAKGATIVAVARREDRLKELLGDMKGSRHFYLLCDVTDLGQIRATASELKRRVGHVDVLINNAGIPSSGKLRSARSEQMEKVIKTNLLGPIWCTKEFLPLLENAPKTTRAPVVVNVASMAGRIAFPNSGDYAATKYGLIGFTESIWSELNSMGIRTLTVCPGLADTEGFPMTKLRANPLTGWAVMDPERVAKAAIAGIERGAHEVRVQWWMNPLYLCSVAVGPLRRWIASGVSTMAGDIDTRRD